jgi:hypothetical protein
MGVTTLSNPAVPVIAAPAAAEAPTDFATLVDSIARARSQGSDAATSAVGVTLSHADFGRVTLHFTPREQGLAVTMRSADPGFAPAVAAATATPGGAEAGSSGGHQPGQQAPHTPAQENPAPGMGAGPQSGNTQGDTARHNARQVPANTPSSRAPAPTSASDDAADDAGIFA